MIALLLAASIVQTVHQHEGAAVHIDHVITHGVYALAAGRSARGPFTDGLRRRNGDWQIVCRLAAQPVPTQLISKCGFPQSTAIEISANEATQAAAERGEFAIATIAQEHAFASARGPDRDQERARLQLLHRLNEQMRTGLITRAQAIQQWNQARFSWMLP